MTSETTQAPKKDLRALMVVAWVWVAVPFGYGIVKLLQKIDALFS